MKHLPKSVELHPDSLHGAARAPEADPALKGNYAFSFVSGCFTCNQMGWGKPDLGVFCHPLSDTVVTGLCSQLAK